MDNLLEIDIYHRPKACIECGGKMIFKGVGEYQCEKCKAIAFDDYGKVRNYIEIHKGTTAAQISEETGVDQRSIRQMLRESRLEVTADSRAFLHCEVCGASIRFGNLCPKCEASGKTPVDHTQNKKLLPGMGGNDNKNATNNKPGLKK